MLSLIAGLMQAFALATPWRGSPDWLLQLVAITIFVWRLEHVKSPRQAACVGGIFALSWMTGTIWWIYIALNTYGGLHPLLAASAVGFLALVLASFYAAACAAYMALRGTSLRWRAALWATLWLAAELARGRWFTGFGWGATAYAQIDGPLQAFIPWVGAYGLTFITAWLAMSLAQLRQAQWGQRAMLLALLPSAWLLGTVQWVQPTGAMRVSLLQGNIPQDVKFQPGEGIALSLRWYAQALGESDDALVVAPETALPLLPSQLPPGYFDALQKRFARGDQAALIGMPMGSWSEGYTNSVVGFKSEQATPWQYDKHHLVPFGEFIPPFFRWFTEMMHIPLGDFRRGALGQVSFEWQGQRLAPTICYEDLFGEELAARFIDADKAPTILVNVSNIAWFGNTVVMDQHLHISRMRALEFARPFVRATNTGSTAIIDAQGRVVSELPRARAGVLRGEVQGQTGLTPYAWWTARFGLWPWWILIALVLMAAFRQRQKVRQQAPAAH